MSWRFDSITKPIFISGIGEQLSDWEDSQGSNFSLCLDGEPKIKYSIRGSRILTSQNLVDALSTRQGIEAHFLSTSAVGYYGFHQDEALDEKSPAEEDFLGSPFGSGKQWFSWIHMNDLVNIYPYLLEEKDISGPINCMGPNPVRNRELTKAHGEALKKPTFMPPIPAFGIKMMTGEFGSILVKGQKVLPERLLDKGFRFRFREISGALQDVF